MAPAPAPIVRLRSADGATAEVHHDGAHVTSWRPAPDGAERLFLSARSALREGVAIRGGVPVIFPQFAAEGPLPRHGFARTTRWTLDHTDQGADEACAVFTLRDSDATRAIWRASFAATLTVRVGGPRLAVGLAVENRGDAPFTFTAALHTYLRVQHLEDVTLDGLRGVRYRESGTSGALHVDESDSLRPEGEVDRVYVDVPGTLVLRERTRTLEIGAAGFPDVVVWNPGPAKASALADLDPGGEQHMLCVEAAAVQRPITLAPGARWEGAQHLSA